MPWKFTAVLVRIVSATSTPRHILREELRLYIRDRKRFFFHEPDNIQFGCALQPPLLRTTAHMMLCCGELSETRIFDCSDMRVNKQIVIMR